MEREIYPSHLALWTLQTYITLTRESISDTTVLIEGHETVISDHDRKAYGVYESC